MDELSFAEYPLSPQAPPKSPKLLPKLSPDQMTISNSSDRALPDEFDPDEDPASTRDSIATSKKLVSLIPNSLKKYQQSRK